jgi:hypothetical protein
MPPLRDPPDPPIHDPPADPTREPDQPFGDPTPLPGNDPPDPPIQSKDGTATDRDTLVALRLPPPLISEIEKWAAKQNGDMSRPEAIRRLVERGLAGARPALRHGKKTAAHAREKAGQAIDRMVDRSAPPHEQEKRKRHLLKGPEEFRDIRADLPKPK